MLRIAHPLLSLKQQQLRSKDGNGKCLENIPVWVDLFRSRREIVAWYHATFAMWDRNDQVKPNFCHVEVQRQVEKNWIKTLSYLVLEDSEDMERWEVTTIH